ncbi:MAG: hypothetical protein H5T32_02355 [Candidatus Methanosuratus sp.]|nr:hypothetical protein [Candidatus Methanosuratincola sp.]
MESELAPLQFLGILLLILGAILFLLPMLLERLPSLERIPWILLYVYKSDGFVFVTSPILIILSLISFLLYILRYRI